MRTIIAIITGLVQHEHVCSCGRKFVVNVTNYSDFVDVSTFDDVANAQRDPAWYTRVNLFDVTRLIVRLASEVRKTGESNLARDVELAEIQKDAMEIQNKLTELTAAGK
jgi:hypothetical protein